MADWKLTIKDTSTGTYYGVPVLPTDGKLGYQDGEKRSVSLDIVDLGEVRIPAGVSLDGMTWRSIFPGYYDKNLCSIPESKMKKPLDYRNLFSSWKDAGTRLCIICPQAGIQKYMFLTSFDWDPVGAFGDISYTVGFTEWKTIKPVKLKTAGMNLYLPPLAKLSPPDRPASPKAASSKTKKAKPTSYTVQDGDSLSSVAKKLGISSDALYMKNRDRIGPNPFPLRKGMVLML